jgi:hypothetical protein
MNKYMNIIRIVASGILLLSFFLPMSSCSYTVPIELGIDEPPSDTTEIPTETRTTIIYASEYLDPDEIGAWLNLLAFTWPILFILLQWKFSGRKYSFLFSGSGVFLSIFSAVVIYTWADLGKPLIGAYVGGSAAIALFAIYLSELIQYLRRGRH